MENVGLILDMDGVIYRGNHLIEGASGYLLKLKALGIPYLFLTNNSQRTRRDVVMKLNRLGIQAEESEVFTCAMATARFLASQKPNGTAYVIGENGLANALHVNGYSVVDDDADYVVVGEGRTLSFEMIEQGVRLVKKGAKLICTNPDLSCPTENGIRPGAGAIVAMIEKATGVESFSVGKPSPVMMTMARRHLGLRTSETVMVGDTMYTDILGGVQLGYRTVLVLSGHTKREELSEYAYRPDIVINRLADLEDRWLFGQHAKAEIPVLVA